MWFLSLTIFLFCVSRVYSLFICYISFISVSSFVLHFFHFFLFFLHIFPVEFFFLFWFTFFLFIHLIFLSSYIFVFIFRDFFFYIEFVLYLPFTFFVFLRSGGLNLSSHNTCTITHLPIHKHHLCHQPKETPTFLKISIFIICFGIFLPINYIILVTSSVAHFPTNKFLLFTSRVFFFFIFFIFLVFQLNYLLLFLFLFTVSHSLHPISSFV